MVKLWAMRVKIGLSVIEDVPRRYREDVKLELGMSE